MMLKLTFLMILKTFTKILLQEVFQLKNNNRVNHLGLLMDFQTFLKVNLSAWCLLLNLILFLSKIELVDTDGIWMVYHSFNVRHEDAFKNVNHKRIGTLKFGQENLRNVCVQVSSNIKKHS